MRNLLSAVVCLSLIAGCVDAGSSQDAPPVGGDDAGQAVDGGEAAPDLRPADPSQGQIFVTFLLKSVSPDTVLKPNTRYEFTYELNIATAEAEQLQLVPRIDAGWSAVVKDTDLINSPISVGGTALTVTRTVVVTTGAAGMADLVLNLNRRAVRSYNPSSQPTRIVLGGMQLPQSDRILVRYANTTGNQSEFRDNTLFVKRQQTAGQYTLSVQLRLSDAGTYKLSDPVAEPKDWNVERTTAASVTVDANRLYTVNIRFTPSSSSGRVTAADGSFRFNVAAADGHVTMPFRAQLRVVDTLPRDL